MNGAFDSGDQWRDVQRFEDVNRLYKVMGVVTGWAISVLCGGVVIFSGVMA